MAVTMNGEVIPVNSFMEYVAHFDPSFVGENTHTYLRPNKRWELAIGPSPDGKFRQISFVNSLTTHRGGTHVNLIADQLARRLADYINRTHKDVGGVTHAQVRSHMSIFVNSLVENPSFDSQLKDFLTTPSGSFGSVPVISDRFSRQLAQTSGIVDQVVGWARAKQRVQFASKMKSGARRSSRLLGIPKLEDANDAGDPELGQKHLPTAHAPCPVQLPRHPASEVDAVSQAAPEKPGWHWHEPRMWLSR